MGKLVGGHSTAIGRYEHEEVKPCIEMATLEVSLDYLVGSTDILLDKNIISKILDIQKLKENDRQHVFALLDAFLKQTKLQFIILFGLLTYVKCIFIFIPTKIILIRIIPKFPVL